jgi:hypothetical protein
MERKMIKLKNYKIKIKLTREMLGTNPIGLDVMDKHIIDRQRKLISENSKINKAVNKYLQAKQISKERGDLELSALRTTVEEMVGFELSEDQFEILKEGNTKKLKSLKETMKELEDKGITCFLRNPETHKVCIGSHMILGFLKAATESISRTLPRKNGTIMNSCSYTTSIINQHINIYPDLIESSLDIKRDDKWTPIYNQRSLRAMTAQGPRISLAKSEVLPKGSEFDFTLQIMDDSPIKKEHIEKMLSYGSLKGLGQWRNVGHGQFEVVSFVELK